MLRGDGDCAILQKQVEPLRDQKVSQTEPYEYSSRIVTGKEYVFSADQDDKMMSGDRRHLMPQCSLYRAQAYKWSSFFIESDSQRHWRIAKAHDNDADGNDE